MNGRDMIAIMEYMKAFNKPSKVKRRTKSFDVNDVDIAMLLQKKLQEASILEKFLKDHEKSNKKEEKKPEGGISLPGVAMFLVFTFPITAPLYVAYVKTLLH